MAATRGLRMYETLTLIRRRIGSSSSRFTPSPPAPPPAVLPPPPPAPTNWSRVIAARPYCTSSSSSQLEKRDDEDDVLDDASPPPSPSSSSSYCSMVNLEKTIHNVIVEECTPDWLPFKPGSSYWAPPVSQHLHVNVIKLLASFAVSESEWGSDEGALSLSTSRGWPSSSYFIHGTSSPHPVPSDFIVEPMVNKNSENTPQTKDEEG